MSERDWLRAEIEREIRQCGEAIALQQLRKRIIRATGVDPLPLSTPTDAEKGKE
jgi:hypothetical protein